MPLFILAVTLLFLQVFCDLSLPNLMSQLVNGILERSSAETVKTSSDILSLGLRMLIIALTGGAAAVSVSFLSTRIAAGIARDLRFAVFQKVESFSSREFDAFSTASLITRCTNDINQVQGIFVMGIRMICYAPVMGIGGIIMALNKAPGMSWIIVLAVVILICLVAMLISLIMPKFRLIQNLVDKLNRIARETLNGLMVIRAFGARDHEIKRFDSVNTDLTKTSLFVNRVIILQWPGMNLIMNSAIILIIWTGARRIAASAMGVGDMMAFIQYTMQIIFSFLFFSMMFVMLPRTAVSADRIAQVLEMEISIRDPEKPASAVKGEASGSVEFKNASFRYEGAAEDAIKNISFTAEGGKTTAIIGATGSGKSTIVNLIMRFYDVTGGSVAVNGVDVRELSQRELRGWIGYVPQKSVLLSGTLAFNLRYGKTDSDEADIREGAEIAQILDFIDSKPEGFESAVAQGGANVSGGQKQRLSIARALVRNPEILIFDDSFSALDFATDAKLRQALDDKRKGVTKIIVAQRVGTIMNADRIIVLENGEIAGMGKHDELMKTCAEYREIAESQFSQEANNE
ncbi:MAG: ABC transporter ATP-binding protein/permease [Treponema sp.]|nr:ABC transporter ATP-binding protein/permease [Treponema sp.]